MTRRAVLCSLAAGFTTAILTASIINVIRYVESNFLAGCFALTYAYVVRHAWNLDKYFGDRHD